MKNSKLSCWVVGILIGLPLAFLLSNCKKDHALTAQEQSGLSGKNNGKTLSVDYHVVWSSIADTNTNRISAALRNTSYSRVILDYNASGWTCDTLFMRVPNQTLWIAGSGSTPGHLIAKTGGFKPVDAIFIKMKAPGCIINGYTNGTDTTQGRATIEMFKSSYIPANGDSLSESRDAIHAGGNNAVVEGVIVKNSGGDGIYIDGGNGGTVKDVIVDGANRNGISVIKATNLAISNSTFKNSSGLTTGAPNGPWAGIDVEPNAATDTLSNITVTSCVFSGNAGNNIVVTQKNLVSAGTLPATTVYFYSCITAGGAANGVEIADLRSNGPASGQVYFQKCHFNYPALSGIYVYNWCAGRLPININRCYVYNAGASSNSWPPIFVYGDNSASANYTIGNVNFENVSTTIDDFNSGHPYIIGGTAYWKGYDSITGPTGALTINRHYTTSNPYLSFTPASGYTNTNMTLTYP